MAWGRKVPARDLRLVPGEEQPRPKTKLGRKAAAAEALFLAMPADQQAQALAAVDAIARAATGLRTLPDPLVDAVGQLVIDFLVESQMPSLLRRPSPSALVGEILVGAPTLLGPHRAGIEAMLKGAGGGG